MNAWECLFIGLAAVVAVFAIAAFAAWLCVRAEHRRRKARAPKIYPPEGTRYEDQWKKRETGND